MTLTERAQRWLQTLERVPPVSMERLQEALQRAGCPPVAAWLDFHRSFAGYVQPIGYEKITWGLIHDAPRWRPKGEVDVEFDDEEEAWFIQCVDGHPSYPFVLDEEGRLDEGPAETFDVHIERGALRWDFCEDPRTPQLCFNVRARADVERIQATTHKVLEASDSKVEYHVSEDLLAVWEIPKQRWVEVFDLAQKLTQK